MYGEEPGLDYWRELAEKRREALETSLQENEELHTSLSKVEEEKGLAERERDNLREMAEQAEELAKIVKSLVTGENERVGQSGHGPGAGGPGGRGQDAGPARLRGEGRGPPRHGTQAGVPAQRRGGDQGGARGRGRRRPQGSAQVMEGRYQGATAALGLGTQSIKPDPHMCLPQQTSV